MSMKCIVRVVAFAAVTGLAGSAASASIVAGPFVNPANGHSYFLLAPADWNSSQTEAVALGGSLATIRDAAENAWVFNTFRDIAAATGVPNQGNLWLGYNDVATEGSFVWSSGESSAFTNWSSSEPSNGGGLEDWTMMMGVTFSNLTAGRWNDTTLDGRGRAQDLTTPLGVVEVVPSAVPPCAADVNSDGTVDGADFIAFINSFAIGDAAVDGIADIAGGGTSGLDPDGTIDGTDFISFINSFSAGC
jgi:hypothetical protein